MSEPDFKDLVSRKVDEAKWPPPLPAGTYYGVVTAFKFDYLPWTDRETGNKIPGCMVTARLTEADPSLADELGEADVTKKTFTNNYSLRPGEDAPLGDFVRSVLGPDSTAGRSWGETLPDTVGKQVMIELSKDIDKKKPENPPRNNIRKMVARPE